MEKYPEVSFIIDIEKEKQTAKNFFDNKEDVWLREHYFSGEAEYLLKFGSTDDERYQELERYISKTYKTQAVELTNSLAWARVKWREVEEAYFAVIDTLFHNRPWPEGNYRAEISIFSMYPRWVDEKLFFIPFEENPSRHTLAVIAHEMLHFMFFDYILERYGLKESTRLSGKDEQYIWNVSEVFNVVIDHFAPYMNAIPGSGISLPYPGQEDMYATMSQQWQEKQDVDWLLDFWFKK